MGFPVGEDVVGDCVGNPPCMGMCMDLDPLPLLADFADPTEAHPAHPDLALLAEPAVPAQSDLALLAEASDQPAHSDLALLVEASDQPAHPDLALLAGPAAPAHSDLPVTIQDRAGSSLHPQVQTESDAGFTALLDCWVTAASRIWLKRSTKSSVSRSCLPPRRLRTPSLSFAMEAAGSTFLRPLSAFLNLSVSSFVETTATAAGRDMAARNVVKNFMVMGREEKGSCDVSLEADVT